MKKIPAQNLRGFTLIEMVVYIGVAAVVISTVVILAVWTIRTGAKAKADREVINNASRAMETIVFEIKRSKSLYAPASVFNANPGQLSLEQKSSSLPDESATFIDFFQCGSSLCLKREGSQPAVLTNEQVAITDLSFEQIQNSTTSPSVQIRLGVESKSGAFGQESEKSRIELTSTAKMN